MNGENFFHEYVEPCQHQHHNSGSAYHYNNQNLMSYGDKYYSGTSVSSKDRIMKISSSENKNTFLSQLNPMTLSKNNECSQDESRISQRLQNSQERFSNILHQETYPIPFPDSTAHIPFNAQNFSRRAKKKTRILFSKEQVRELEACFRRQRYLTAIERDDMALSINLTSNQVKIWFQNRRYKIKKMTEISPCKSFPKLFDNTSNSTRSAH